MTFTELELLTAAQMRAIERAAIDGGAVSGRALMETAGAAAAAEIVALWPEFDPESEVFTFADRAPRALILCGPGNNGGDGWVIARRLKATGWEVKAASVIAEPGAGSPDAVSALEDWRAAGGEVLALDEVVAPDGAEADGVAVAAFGDQAPDVIVDAIFGTGLSRPLSEDLARILDALRPRDPGPSKSAPKVVAVDAPSGLCADSGRPLGGATVADLTVSFHRAKTGHHLALGPLKCGRLKVVSIGLPQDPGALPTETTPRQALVGKPLVQSLRKDPIQHKYGHGHALILSGGVGRGGAARMAARAALRVGAGLVTLAPPPAALIENAAHLDAIMLRALPDAAALTEMLADPRLNALLLGPGLGKPERARPLVEAALDAPRNGLRDHPSGAGRPARRIALDADALTAFAGAPQALFDRLHDGVVLTPHMGEFARLFPDIADRLSAEPARGPAFSRLDAAREASARAGCTLLLKGADTVIARPDGRAAIHSAAYGREAPWLATAGAGDVLAGLIAGLLARGLAPFDAACAAAWLHVEAARAFGPGLIAEDLPDLIPRVLRDLGV